MDVLRRTPSALSALLRGLGDGWIRATEGVDTFSPFDVVGHLIDGEETDWLHRARLILESGPDCVFQPYDRFRHLNRNKGKQLDELLDEFATLRSANLVELESLGISEADLGRQGVHPSLGVVTLRQLLSTWVVHDLSHVAQVARVMAKQYRTEVGPWKAFTPILLDREK